jgi:hypothetical protein
VDGDLSRVTIHTNAQIIASEAGNWFWTNGFNPGMLDLFIYESADEGAELLWSDQREADGGGFVIVDNHGLDLVSGNYIVVSDGVTQKGLVLQPISITMFDTEYEFMAGTAPAGRDVTVVAGMAEAETQATINLTADPESGEWSADFAEIGFDITEEMQPWSFAHIYDGDGDANEGGVPPLELWTAYFTYDPGTWAPDGHSYHFESTYTFPVLGGGNPTPEISFTVADDAPQYYGYVMLRPFAVRAKVDGECPDIDPILHPDQMTRFVYGWGTDYPMTYDEALAHFNSMTVTAHWENDQSVELVRHDIMLRGTSDICSFTE